MLLYIPQVSLIKSIFPAFPYTTGETMECTTPGGGGGTPHMPHFCARLPGVCTG